MRSLTLLLTAAFLTASPVLAQVGILWDSVPPDANAHYVRAAADGSVTTGGGSTVTRLSADGTTQWTSSVAPGSIKAIALGPDGSVAVLLSVESGGMTLTDIGVVRLSSDGVAAWRHVYDGANGGSAFREIDQAIDIAVDGQGNVFATATDGYNDDAMQTWSLMHSAAGMLLWSRTYAALLATPRRAAMDCAGNAYVIGRSRVLGGDGEPGFLLSYAPDGTLRQLAVVAPPTGGTVNDSQTYFHDLAVECDGTAYVAGVEAVFRDSPDVGTQTAFVSRFDPGSSAPAWTAAPFGDQSGAAFSRTGGHVNLAIGGPDAIYAQAAPTRNQVSNNRIQTVRLHADGTTAWTDADVVSSSISSERIAADVTGVVVTVLNDLEPTVHGNLTRHLDPDGVETWSVQRVHGSSNENNVMPGANSMATYPGGGAVWSERFGHVLRVGEPLLPPAVTELQVVHASAAIAALGPLEVYLNQPSTSTTPDATVSFRAGSAFLSVPSGQPLAVRARLQNAPPPFLPREVSFTAPPLPAGRFVASLAGIPDEVLAFYAQNPDGIIRAIQLIVTPIAGPTVALGEGGVPVVVANAVTDAPAVDVVVAETGQVLADDLAYGQAVQASLAPGTYTIDVRRASDGTRLSAAQFTVDASGALAVFTVSGFLNPATNQNGPTVAVTATDATGASNPGMPVTSEDAAASAGLALAVANPVRGSATVRFKMPVASVARLVAVDVLGREVAVLSDSIQAAGDHEARLEAGRLTPGVYVLRLTVGTAAAARTVTIVH